MAAGQRHVSKNTMFWRADEKLKALMRDPRWPAFHRACGREGLFFDDIDPINDKPHKDVTDAMRGGGYQAVAFRAEKDRSGSYISVFCGRGTGQGPVDAVIAAYQDAIKRGDPVAHGHETILTAEVAAVAPDAIDAVLEQLPPPPPPTDDINIEELIG